MPSCTTTTPADATQDTVPCFDCGADTGKISKEHRFTYGIGADAVELTVTLPVHVCPHCGFECLDHEGQTLKHEAVCAHLGVLSPKEIRGIREKYRMSRAAFSKVTGLGEATLNRWENAILIQNIANDRFLRLLADPNNMRQLQRVASEPPGTLQPSTADDPPPRATQVDRFRFIDVSDERRRRQQNFRLCPTT